MMVMMTMLTLMMMQMIGITRIELELKGSAETSLGSPGTLKITVKLSATKFHERQHFKTLSLRKSYFDSYIQGQRQKRP